MKKFFKSRLFCFIILIIATVITVTLGAVSYARFEMNYHDEIIAEYTDFCLSHDGEGKSTILSKNSSGGYEGFMSISVNNTIERTDGVDISKRKISFIMRTPNEAEIVDDKIYDAWGQPIAEVTDATSNYTINLVDDYGNDISSDIILGTDNLTNPQFASKNVNLQITRNASAGELNGIEKITVVIVTSLPYKNTLAFTISVSSRKIMFTSMKKDYFGFEDIDLNIITADSFEFSGLDDTITTNPVRIVLTYTNSVLIFDYERFRLSVEGNLFEGNAVYSNEYSYSSGTITLYLMPGSDVNLHFYVNGTGSYSIQAEVDFDMNEDEIADYDYTNNCAGLTSGIVISK